MDQNRRFTILTFPQYFDGKALKVNIVFLPRSQNPLAPAIEGVLTPPAAKPFADAKLSFVAKIITGLTDLPVTTPSITPIPLSTTVPASARPLFEALAGQFKISNLAVLNTNANINNVPPAKRAPAPVSPDQSIRKYLPLSYRKSFNFVAPRTKNAVTNDTYFCAVRDATPNTAFTQSDGWITWGQVFAHALRQPLLAEALGMIYKTELTIDASYFPKGGWLYVDLADESDYFAQQNLDDTFIRRYAARIPDLVPGKTKNVFAPILFPVQAVPTPGNYEQLFIEAADYDDGFGKIVHGFQPVSNNLMAEESDGFHPTKDAGIRLGWDDEQILIWYMRQLSEDVSVGSNERIDAPLGVFGYRIDVRPKTIPPGNWESLNAVTNKAPLVIIDPSSNKKIPLGDFKDKGIELNYQVYPAQISGATGKDYWLPMYFANWNGKSMVLPDDEAAAIYQQGDVQANGQTNVTGAPDNNMNKIYAANLMNTILRYGNIYDFRVRFADMSGGGPEVGLEPTNHAASQIATVHFKRYIAPNTPRIARLPVNTEDSIFQGAQISIKRPLLGYPAVVFTDKYKKPLDPVELLKKASKDMAGTDAFGIADPDVESVEITVEVQTLKMDNLMSVSGKEAYINYYTTTRLFPKASQVFEDELLIPLEYRDCKILNFGDPGNLGDLGLTQDEIDAMDKLPLPTERTIRLTLRAVCEKKSNYYGLEQTDKALNTRYGRTVQFLLYKQSTDEKNLFIDTSDTEKLRGIYLQPDAPYVYNGNPQSLLFGKVVEKAPDMIQRLSQQLGLENKGLTLMGKKGKRVQFGCSQRIRHTLSPDNSSITFASKGDLTNHWLCCVVLEIDRDWTWDGLKDRSFIVQRQLSFREDGKAEDAPKALVGDIEIKKTAPFNALIKPDRSGTTLIFIDAVETKKKPLPPPHDNDPVFPDLINVIYTLQPQFKESGITNDGDVALPLLTLPITLPPAQVPKIASAGIALSPYQRNEKYSTTEPRRRYLWIELEEPMADPKDICFARVLAYAPDQLISNNNPELLVVPDEPALPIDAEYIRVITHEQPNDEAGLDAMQPMEKAKNSDKHYLLPLPSGLHSESPEMFGFFTYEFRVGHYQYSDTNTNHEKGENVWTTAQARFGRALRTTGIQHPAPTLTCIVNRDEEKIYVSAPYAVAVNKGKNVTADPPRTQLWGLLYAQVKQADNKDFRNILLDDKQLDWRVRVEHKKDVDWNMDYDVTQVNTLKKITIQNWNGATDIGQLAHMHQLADFTGINKDATKYGTVIWTSDEISQMLSRYGLPLDSALSVLCVEILPQITNIYEHVSQLNDKKIQTNLKSMLAAEDFISESTIKEGLAAKTLMSESINFSEAKPLSDKLGHHRILRTSPLAEVPFVCCKQC